MKHPHSTQETKIPALRLLAWETTRRCNLACLHCRAAAGSGPYPGELTTAEGLKLLDDLATMGQVVVILTGGEPLLRDDIYDLAAHGTKLGHRMVMAVNGTLLTPDIVDDLVGAYPRGVDIGYPLMFDAMVLAMRDEMYRKIIHDWIEGWITLLKEALDLGVDQGRFQVDDTEKAARAISSIYHGFAIRWYLDRPNHSTAWAREHCRVSIKRYLGC